MCNRFEHSLEDSMEPALHKQLMTLVFEQCLCCFRHHPEVWLSYCKYTRSYLKELHHANVLILRGMYREAIGTIPYCALLRIAWAEMEEEAGNMEISRDILRVCYEFVPSALTFSVLQRHIRRKEGKTAARKCFSETLPLRLERKLPIEVYYAHAELELNMNADAQTACNILKLAHKYASNGRERSNEKNIPSSSTSAAAGTGVGLGNSIEYDITYIRMMTRVLVQLNDLDQLR